MEENATRRRDSSSALCSAKCVSYECISPPSSRCTLWTTYLNVMLYSLCYHLQQPVEPFLLQKLLSTSNDDYEESIPKVYGRLQALFFTLQAIGAPLVGILLDQIGIRHTSAVVFLACALSYSLLGMATTLPILVCSKLPSAFQAGFLVAQATATTGNESEGSRALALGRMTSAFVLGATVGPALGGYLAGLDLYLGARLAVVGSLLAVFLSLLYLPKHDLEGMKNGGLVGSEAMSKVSLMRPSFGQHIRRLCIIASRSALLPLFLVKVVGGVVASMHSTALPLVLSQKLHFNTQTLGLVMSSGMLGVAFFSAFGVKPLTNLVGASGMSQGGVLARAVLGLVMAFITTTTSLHLSIREEQQWDTPHTFQLVIATAILHGVASHALATGLTTQTTGAVDPEHEQGALLGIEHCLFGVARIGGPPFGIYMLGLLESFWTVASVCAFIDVALCCILIHRPFEKKDQDDKCNFMSREIARIVE